MRLVFIPTQNAPVVFYRMENYVKYLRKFGHEVAFTHRGPSNQNSAMWEHNVHGQVAEAINMLVETADVAVFQVVHTRWAIALLHALKERHKTPMLLDCDDDFYSNSAGNPTSLKPGDDSEVWMDEHARLADGVICSTPELSERWMNRYGKQAHVIPNCIDTEIWEPLKKDPRPGVVGWAGAAGHRLDLRLLQGVTSRVKAKFEIYSGHLPVDAIQTRNVKQIHMTERVPMMKLPKGKAWWRSIDKYPAWLSQRRFSVALAPLVDSQFNRAKSPLRWLEYSALGIPTVASPVRPFREVIQHAKTGMLAHDEDDWVRCLNVLLNDDALRREIGENARSEVFDNWNADKVTRRYEDILKEYAEAKK